MVEEKLKKIEEKIRQSENLPVENKAALIELLAELKSELKENNCDVRSNLKEKITDINHKEEGIIKSTFSELNHKIEGFEESHPRLVQLVNAICTQLSNSGL